MDKGLGGPLLPLQILHFLVFWTVFVGWPALAVAALITLRRSSIAGLPRLGWTLLVLVVPVVGALSLLIVRPEANAGSAPSSP